MEITDKKFWNEFWSMVEIPQTVNFNFKNDRIISDVIKAYIPKSNKEKRAIEIGCAPGKWLVFFNKHMGYLVDGVEYIEAAVEKTICNMKMNNVPEDQFNVYMTDFLKWDIKNEYDVVFSLGFIEHFKDYNRVMDSHLKLLNKNGYLIIGVPRFRGINYFLQKIIETFSNVRFLNNHNLNVMDISLYKQFGNSRKIQNIYIGYVGGFEPGLFPTNKINNNFIRFFVKALNRLLSILFGKINSRFTSSYLLSIYKR